MASVSIRKLGVAFGALKVLRDLDVEIESGEFIVLLGPSGCGKSTLLNAIAGLLDADSGQIWIGGKNVTWEEPKDRGIGMVFQSYALYPQMTVERNLSFGLRVAGIPKDEIDKRVNRTAELLQIQPLLKRKPSELSGGQRQRVAIGRALVRDVDVFLFDEPLSNLDAKLRTDLRVEIKRLHNRLKNTMIYVTHDQIEALTLADRIAIMRSGIIQQFAPPTEIYNKPINKYVAGFIGSPSMNFLSGSVRRSGNDHFMGKNFTVPLERYDFSGDREGEAVFGIRPEHIVTGDAADAMPFKTEVDVDVVEPMGSDTLVWAEIGGEDLRIRMDGQAQVKSGDRLKIGFDPAHASIFVNTDETRL